MTRYLIAAAAACLFSTPAWSVQTEIPAGTRFMAELKKTLEAKNVKPGKSFEARTVEALRASDGSFIRAGAKLKGRVSYASDSRMILRFEQIDTGRGKIPVVASVVGVSGEKGAAMGAGAGAATGAAVGAASGGKDLILREGTRMELALDRPLTFERK